MYVYVMDAEINVSAYVIRCLDFMFVILSICTILSFSALVTFCLLFYLCTILSYTAWVVNRRNGVVFCRVKPCCQVIHRASSRTVSVVRTKTRIAFTSWLIFRRDCRITRTTLMNVPYDVKASCRRIYLSHDLCFPYCLQRAGGAVPLATYVT